MRGSRARTVIHTNAVFCNQGISPLLESGTHTPLEIFHPLSKDDALTIASVSQEAGGIRHFMSSTRTPPPPVNTSTCKDTYRKIRTGTDGMCIPHVSQLVPRSCSLSSSKTIVSRSSQNRIASHDTFHCLFSLALRFYQDHERLVCFVIHSLCPDVFAAIIYWRLCSADL
jgi:hypothetical protein